MKFNIKLVTTAIETALLLISNGNISDTTNQDTGPNPT